MAAVDNIMGIFWKRKNFFAAREVSNVERDWGAGMEEYMVEEILGGTPGMHWACKVFRSVWKV